jgi:hypothetical protein
MQIRDLPRMAALAMAVCGGLAACSGAGCGGPRSATHPPGDSGDSGDSNDSGDSGTGSGGSDGAIDDGNPVPPIDAGPAIGPLRVDPRNRRYFSDGSARPVYLTGSHTWGNLKDRAVSDPPPMFDYPAFLDFLVAHHHNFIRLWTWEQPHSADQTLLFFAPFPWMRTGPGTANDGKPKFDLDRLDSAYFDRLRARVVAARDRGIYVAVMLFDGWDLVNGYNSTDGGFPFGAGNNINGVALATGIAALSLADRAITARQEAYVRAVIDAVNDLDNVLYEIANETDASGVQWQYHMIDFVKSVEAGKPKQHPVGMTSTYPGNDSDLFASRADWISPNGAIVPSDGTKVILNDTDHSYGWLQLKTDGAAAQRAWAWKTLCIGSQPLFMDPYLEPWTDRNNPSGGRPDPAWNTIRDALGRTRQYAERLDLSRVVPSTTLCSTGFCLVDPGREYLVYKPPGAGGFTLTMVAGTYRFEWFNPATGAVGDTGMITVGAEQHTFTPPFSGDAVLLLQRP